MNETRAATPLAINTSGCTPYGVDRTIEAVRAEGAYLYAADGRSFIDLANVFGSVLLGHADPDVTEAVVAAVRSGLPAASNMRHQSEIIGRFAADLGIDVDAAFFKTGTAATRAAVCAAQKATGRRLVASAGYHGYDAMWDDAELLTPNDAGVIHFYYVPEFLERILAEHRDELAAVIIAPDYVHIAPEVTASLFRRCRESGIVTVADDVKYGYRLTPGSSLKLGGATADLYLYSKGIANGWPISCVVGDSTIMSELSLASSTLTYDQPTLSAAVATLRKLAEYDVQESIAAEGARFVAGAARILAASDLPIEVAGAGAAFQFVATPEVEEVFLAETTRAGLIFEPGDQQLPSYSFRGAVVDAALDSFDTAVKALATGHPELVGIDLTRYDRLVAAFTQMDGVAAPLAVGMNEADIRQFILAQRD